MVSDAITGTGEVIKVNELSKEDSSEAIVSTDGVDKTITEINQLRTMQINNNNTEKVITSNVTCDRNDNIDNVKRTIGTETPHLNDESCSTG